jgi:formamidopyrimidine-DNA glycosylase
MLALSDARKFAKIELWRSNELLNSEWFKNLGSEPLEKSFTFKKFKQAITKKKGKVKQILMIPEVIAGIGNIYASEALWQAKIHPEKNTQNLKDKELKELYKAIQKVLTLGIDLGGDSFSDYRNINGQKGKFNEQRKVYKRENEICSRCKKEKIHRIKFGGRSSFFCPHCQKL